MIEAPEVPADRPGIEEIIVRSDVDRAVRNTLFLRGQYLPADKDVKVLSEKAIERLNQQYGNLQMIRKEMPGETLQPAVDAAVKAVMG